MSGHLRRRALVVAILVLLSVVSGGAAIAVWRHGIRHGHGDHRHPQIRASGRRDNTGR